MTQRREEINKIRNQEGLTLRQGFAVRLVGPSAGYYDVKYYAHVANYGDTPIAANGNLSPPP